MRQLCDQPFACSIGPGGLTPNASQGDQQTIEMSVSFLLEADAADKEETNPHGRDQIAHDSSSTQSIKACNQKDHRYDTQSGSDASVGERIRRARGLEKVDDIARAVNL
jgi:hypothetical protein